MVALLQLLNAFCCFSSLLSFWLPWIYSPFPFFMEFRNDVLLQLVECIESTQNEVKRKMIASLACNAVLKSLHHARAKTFRATPRQLHREAQFFVPLLHPRSTTVDRSRRVIVVSQYGE
jgi:hypothetical protein